MTQKIAVYNRSTTPLGFDLAAFVAAMNEYVTTAVAPAWNVSAELHVAEGPVSGEWGFVFLDDADAPGALAYHDEETGAPISKVFVRTILDSQSSVTVAASHELVEMLVDPLCCAYTTTEDPLTLYALEAADPVEDDALGFDVAGFKMSDFVYPSWFDRTASGRPGVRFDHVGAFGLSRPFQVVAGGYVITLKDGAVNQVFGSSAKATEFAREDRRGHRSEFRALQVRGEAHGAL